MSLESLGADDKALAPEELVAHCVEANQNVLDALRIKRNQWQKNHDLYNGMVNYDEKQDWQSKNALPKVKMAVRTSKAILKNSLVKADQFFTFDGLNDESKEIEEDIQDALSRLLDQTKFKQKKFSRGVWRGLLENLIIFKVYPVRIDETDDQIHELQEYKVAIEPVSAFDLRIDPTGRGKFIVHKVKIDLSDFRKLVEQGVYRKEALDVINESFQQEEDAYNERVRAGQIDIPKPAWRKEVELLEYWGDVDRGDGRTAHENVTFTVANRKALARAPIKNPYRHGKPPFVFGPILEKDGSVYHEGFLDGVTGLAEMITESMNVVLDSHLSSSIPAHVVNLDYMHNPTELSSGVYPGKVFKARGVPPGAKFIEQLKLGTFDPASLQILATLDREFQNGTGVNEFISGSVGVGDKTATEVKAKAAQSQGLLSAIAEEIEDNVLEPLIEMVYQIMLQYNPEVFGDNVAQVSAEKLRFKFIAKGLSKILAQSEQLNQVFMWIGMVSKTPIGQMINWDEIGEMSARLINQDPKKLLKEVQQGQPLMQMIGGQNGQ